MRKLSGLLAAAHLKALQAASRKAQSSEESMSAALLKMERKLGSKSGESEEESKAEGGSVRKQHVAMLS